MGLFFGLKMCKFTIAKMRKVVVYMVILHVYFTLMLIRHFTVKRETIIALRSVSGTFKYQSMTVPMHAVCILSIKYANR